MRKQSTSTTQESKVIWERVEEWIQEPIQPFLQGVLENEGREFLGRQKSANLMHRGGKSANQLLQELGLDQITLNRGKRDADAAPRAPTDCLFRFRRL